MSNNNISIHDFEFQLICEYFSSVERQGPGSPEVTIKALNFIDGLTANSRIADIGCGTGGQTMVLGKKTPGAITGIDLFPGFIELFNQNSREAGLNERIKGLVGSMDNLPFEEEELDLIWSEGAIYNIGFKRGLEEWRKFIKTSGYIAVTEAVWFTEKRPDEINTFWQAYPEIDTIPVKVTQMHEAGYLPVASFILPEHCWTDHFFMPQVAAQELFLKKYPDNPTAEALVANLRHEAVLYKKYKDFYGYAFFIGKKI
jgi:SAM-dependent methyltransferase